MGFDKIKIKQVSFIIILIFIMIFLTVNISNVIGLLAFLFDIIAPFLIGSAIAFIINIPMTFLENKWLKRWNGKISKKFKRPVCCILSVIIIFIVLTLISVLVVSQIRKTSAELTETIPIFIENCKNKCTEIIDKIQDKFPYIKDLISSISNMDFIKNGVVNIISRTAAMTGNITGNIISTIVKITVAFVFAIYILLQKEKLCYQFKSLMYAFLSRKIYHNIIKILRLFSNITRKFISGQCIEALILGSMFVITMWILRFPYAIFIGVVIAFTALIPIVGAFIGCAVGIFLIFIQSPAKAFWFVILFLVLQQIEGNFIYPKVVGNSVGLPSIWVLAAITIGGSLMGIIGMLIFIPITSTLYTLLQKSVHKRIALKLGKIK